MSVLQQELGVTLFRPLGRGIEPTDEAHEIYKRSKEILGLLNQLSEPHKEIKHKSLRIGLTEIFSHSLTGQLPGLFPNEEIEIHELDAGEIEVSLLNGQIDFGISFVPYPRQELEYLKVSEVTFGAFKRSGSLDSIQRDQLPFVVPVSLLPSNPLSLKLRDGWPLGVSRTTPFKASSLTIALQLACSGSAAIFIPHFLAASLNRGHSSQSKLSEIKYPASEFAKSKREIFIVKRKSSEETPAMKVIARLIRVSCKET